jgi:serine/threonine protein kinase/tetratricopeptide (TPR) repeat protein
LTRQLPRARIASLLEITDVTDAGRQPELPPGSLVGRYRIIDVLGRGGMGVVYKAVDPELDRPIALKLVACGLGTVAEEARLRLLREAKTLAQLSHPNIVTVHDVGSHDGHLFVAMEFVVGLTLRAWLANAPTSREILRVFRAAASGLAAAHRLGIVHRDFKPDNVLVGDDGRVRVVDFGIAQVNQMPRGSLPSVPISDPEITRTGAIMGTPVYMAPEQDLGKPVDGRSDQFSFCAALYEALFAVRPFAGDMYEDIRTHRLAGQLTTPVKAPYMLPRVRRALRRGLEREPENRHTSMDALLLALDEPRRWRQLAIIVLAAMALAGGGWATWLATHQPPSTDELCSVSSETEIEQVWGPKRHVELIESFGANASVATSLAASLDDYVAEWKRRRMSACRRVVSGGSARDRNDVSEMQLQCLRERARALDARVAVLVHAAREPQVERATLDATGLKSLQSCDGNGLPGLADDQRDRVLEDVFAGTAALSNGDLDEAERRAKHAISISTTGGNEPDAAALLLLGRAQAHGSASTSDAQATLLKTLRAATQVDDKDLVADAWSELIGFAFVDRRMLNHLEDKLFSADLAGLRLDKNDDRSAGLALSIARLEVLRGELDAAFAKLTPILAYYQRDPEKYKVEVATTETTIGLGLTLRGDFKEAQTTCERAVARFESMPAVDVNMSAAIFCLADIAALQRDFTTAQNLEARRVTILEHLGNAARPQLALAHFGFAYTLARGGECVKARPLLVQTRSEIPAVFGEDSPFVGFALLGEGYCALAAGHKREAIALLERAYTLAREPPSLLHLPRVQFTLARALVDQDKSRAIDLAEQALTEFAKYPGARSYREDVEDWLAAAKTVPEHHVKTGR